MKWFFQSPGTPKRRPSLSESGPGGGGGGGGVSRTFPHERGAGVVLHAGGYGSVVGHRGLLLHVKGGVVDDFIQNLLRDVLLQELEYLLNFPLWVLYVEELHTVVWGFP